MLFLFCHRLCRCRDADAGSNACADRQPMQIQLPLLLSLQKRALARTNTSTRSIIHFVFSWHQHTTFLSPTALNIKQITRLICFISILFHLNAHIIHGSCYNLGFFFFILFSHPQIWLVSILLLLCYFPFELFRRSCWLVWVSVWCAFVPVHFLFSTPFQFDWQIFIFQLYFATHIQLYKSIASIW